MLAIAQKIFGSANHRLIKSFYKIVEDINALEEENKSLSDDQLPLKTMEFKALLNTGKTVDDLLVPAFALVREASRRILGMRHFDVQLIGGIVLHRGMISEMKTGEGKTLVATLAAYLNSLTGKGVHVVTVNDYLAKRDCEWMGKLYQALGVSSGYITNDMSDEERKKIYNYDILYSTNNELGFDYLRDNMKFSQEEMVQRGFHYAIVDEVDSILIDEARTPLIISGQLVQDVSVYEKINKLSSFLTDADYELDEKNRSVFLTEVGILKVEELLLSNNLITPGSSLYDTDNMIMMHYFDQTLRAHKLFTLDKDYVVKDGEVVIIDEFTGRMMSGRRYSDGLHQALEAKEGLEVHNENQTLASTTFQNYFRMYNKIAGMTGTAATESEEFWEIYRLTVAQIPTNVQVLRSDLDDDIYCTEQEKFNAVINFIEERHKNLQPILVGTVSIEKSEHLSSILKSRNIKHSVLNARYHEQEAYIIAQAGRPGAITIATNMAGRGTDIQLGGNPEMLAKTELSHIIDGEQRKIQYHKIEEQVKIDREIVLKSGGLCVVGTERHESRRIDNQLRGRSGRQGDPGSSKFFLSLEDDLLRIFGSDKIKGTLQRLGLKDNEAIQHPWISRALEKAQGKVESRNYDIRKSLLKFDDVINEQRKVVFQQRNRILSGDSYSLMFISSEINESIINRLIPDKYYETEEEHYHSIIEEFSRTYDVTLKLDLLSECDSKDEILKYLNSESDKLFNYKIAEFNSHTDNLWDFAVKRVMILTLDYLWREHLSALESLKYGISLRAVGQKDPLNEFKREAFLMLEEMLNKFQELIVQRLAHLKLDSEIAHTQTNKIEDNNHMIINKNELSPKISRNQQCPCGSGKKYKHCHG